MDYLKEHPIYLDYTHKIAYIAPPCRYLERVPVTFNIRNAPMIDVSLEADAYSLKTAIRVPHPSSTIPTKWCL